MVTMLQAVRFEVREPVRTASFWAGLLTRGSVNERAGVLLPGSSAGCWPWEARTATWANPTTRATW